MSVRPRLRNEGTSHRSLSAQEDDYVPWDGHHEMLVFDEFLWECLHHPHMHPGSSLSLDHDDAHQCEMVNDRVCFSGAILKDGDEIYLVGEYQAGTKSWWARWPD